MASRDRIVEKFPPDNASFEMSDPLQPILSRLAAEGSAVAITQALRLVLRFGSMATLARLLTPAEFGLFGMAALVYGLLQTGRDLGLSSAAVQHGETTPRESTLLFWLQSGAGLMVAAVTCALAPLTAAHFQQPPLTAMVCALGLAFFLSGLGGQFRVELSRALCFQTISIVEVLGLAAGISAAIALAALGAGYWALVAMVLTQETAVLIGLFVTTPWRPQGRPDFTGAGSFIRTGLYLSGFSLVHYLREMADQLCVATRFGSQALGLYGRAWQLGTLPTHGLIAGLTGWMTQGLVKLRDQPDTFRAWCRRILNALAFLCLPLAGVLIVAPKEVLQCLLGPQWIEAAPVLRWIALTLPLQPWLFAELWILTACRSERRLLALSLARLAALVVILLVNRDAGPTAIASFVAAVQWIFWPCAFLVVTRSSPLRGSDIFRAHALPLLLGAVLGGTLQFTKPWWGAQSNGIAIASIVGLTLLITASFALFSQRARGEMTGAIQLLRGRVG